MGLSPASGHAGHCSRPGLWHRFTADAWAGHCCSGCPAGSIEVPASPPGCPGICPLTFTRHSSITFLKSTGCMAGRVCVALSACVIHCRAAMKKARRLCARQHLQEVTRTVSRTREASPVAKFSVLHWLLCRKCSPCTPWRETSPPTAPSLRMLSSSRQQHLQLQLPGWSPSLTAALELAQAVQAVAAASSAHSIIPLNRLWLQAALICTAAPVAMPVQLSQWGEQAPQCLMQTPGP